jgi:hypothetical protein
MAYHGVEESPEGIPRFWGLLPGDIFKWLILLDIGSSGRTRTYNPSVNSRMLCH